ncbi:hypothetical protein REPUB_Repub01dG0223500 [Reevesia pubescens]
MAESVVSNVAARLGELVLQEANFLGDVEDQVKGLQSHLRWMKAILDSRQAEDERVREWVAEIREIAYDAEDVIETFALKIAYRRRGGFSNAIKRYACILKEGWMLHKVKSDIEGIRRKITDLSGRLQLACGIKELSDGASSSSSSKRQQLRQSYPHIVETNVVGFDNDIKKLVSVLVDEERHFRVASICGMGGIGKTTLAKKVYHHSRVRSHFKYLVWAYISQQCQRKTVWKGILSGLGLIEESQRGGIPILEDDQELAKRLSNFLKENKCLVELDDIWSAEDWKAIRPAFPGMEEITGSKILLTTRNKDVALHIDSRGCLHELQCLTDEDSLKLFQNIAFPRSDCKDYVIEEKMVELGKDMVKQCVGLPLAIVVLGGILATKYSLNEWQTVHENVKSYLRRGRVRRSDEVLALSYDDLPAYLKPCFLYLSIFPEDYEIPAAKLIQLWVAEDLVGEGEGEEMVEDVAEGYLNELAERYMVQVGKRDASLKIKTCRMHDLVRDLCLMKSEQENYVYIVDRLKMEQTGVSILSSAISGKVRSRRLAVHNSVLIDSIKAPRVRSLLYFDEILTENFVERFPHYKSFSIVNETKLEDHGIIRRLWLLFSTLLFLYEFYHKTQGLLTYIFRNFKLLRVLDFDNGSVAMGCKLLTDIGCLTHLRYLNLGDAWVSSLPPSLSKLRCLITLDLRVDADTNVHVPNVLWMMRRLRHLYLPKRCDRKTKLKLGNLRNLQTLVNFNTKNCYLEDLFNMKNLKELAINTSFNVENFREDLDLNPPIITSKHLRSLSIMSGERINPRHLTCLLSGCVNIYELDLSVQITKLPELRQISSNIAHIRLSESELDEDPMPTLEKLPKLRILELGNRAFVGMIMICSANGFPRLEFLSISSHSFLEELRVNKGAMSNLRHLMIAECRNLKVLPDELSSITALKELKIENMPKAFKDRLVEGGEDYYKVQHVPSIIFRKCDDRY